jgi:hypothetical protein
VANSSESAEHATWTKEDAADPAPVGPLRGALPNLNVGLNCVVVVVDRVLVLLLLLLLLLVWLLTDPWGVDRKSHKERVVAFVAANNGATVDGFHAILVMRASKSNELVELMVVSTPNRPINGLVL